MSQPGSQLFDDNIPNFNMKDISKKWSRTRYHMSCVDNYFENICICTIDLTIDDPLFDNISLINHLQSFMLLNDVCVDCTLQYSYLIMISVICNSI